MTDPYPGRHQQPDPIERYCERCDYDMIWEYFGEGLWECVNCANLEDYGWPCE